MWGWKIAVDDMLNFLKILSCDPPPLSENNFFIFLKIIPESWHCMKSYLELLFHSEIIAIGGDLNWWWLKTSAGWEGRGWYPSWHPPATWCQCTRSAKETPLISVAWKRQLARCVHWPPWGISSASLSSASALILLTRTTSVPRLEWPDNGQVLLIHIDCTVHLRNPAIWLLYTSSNSPSTLHPGQQLLWGASGSPHLQESSHCTSGESLSSPYQCPWTWTWSLAQKPWRDLRLFGKVVIEVRKEILPADMPGHHSQQVKVKSSLPQTQLEAAVGDRLASSPLNFLPVHTLQNMIYNVLLQYKSIVDSPDASLLF